MSKVTHITLYKENSIDKEYQLSIEEFVEGMIEAEAESNYLKASPLDREIVLYIGVNLDSSPENVPLEDEELKAIINEYKDQKDNL